MARDLMLLLAGCLMGAASVSLLVAAAEGLVGRRKTEWPRYRTVEDDLEELERLYDLKSDWPEHARKAGV